ALCVFERPRTDETARRTKEGQRARRRSRQEERFGSRKGRDRLGRRIRQRQEHGRIALCFRGTRNHSRAAGSAVPARYKSCPEGIANEKKQPDGNAPSENKRIFSGCTRDSYARRCGRLCNT